MTAAATASGFPLWSVVPFVIIPVALGTVITLFLVNVFPARRARDVLMLMGLLFAITLVMTSVFPILSRQLAADRAAAGRTLRATTRAFLSLGLPLAAGGLVLAPQLARAAGISLLELAPTDESLESVFAYLVGR